MGEETVINKTWSASVCEGVWDRQVCGTDTLISKALLHKGRICEVCHCMGRRVTCVFSS